MIWAMDTSVAVAALVTGHPHFAACHRLLAEAESQRIALVVAASALTEAFARLCHLPVRPAISPASAAVLIRDGLERRCRIASIDVDLQRQALAAVVASGRDPTTVGHALHVACAKRARATQLWTLEPTAVLPFWDEEHVREP